MFRSYHNIFQCLCIINKELFILSYFLEIILAEWKVLLIFIFFWFFFFERNWWEIWRKSFFFLVQTQFRSVFSPNLFCFGIFPKQMKALFNFFFLKENSQWISKKQILWSHIWVKIILSFLLNFFFYFIKVCFKKNLENNWLKIFLANTRNSFIFYVRVFFTFSLSLKNRSFKKN